MTPRREPIRRRRLVAAAVATALFTGCGGAADDDAVEAPTATMTATPPGPATETEPAGDPTDTPEEGPMDEVGILDQDDDGTTTVLALEEMATVRLDGAWMWTLVGVEGPAVDVAPVNYFDDPGFAEWAVTAVAEGTASAQFEGEGVCGDEAACAARTVTLTFEVSG